MRSVIDGVAQFATTLVGQFELGSQAMRVSIISFSTSATLRLDLSDSRSAIEQAIGQATASAYGLTCISCALDDARQQLDANARSGAEKMVVLLTDGVQTVDGGDASAVSAAGELKAAG